jgi:hypothetical protein
MSGPMTTADDDEERQRPEVLRYTLVKPCPGASKMKIRTTPDNTGIAPRDSVWQAIDEDTYDVAGPLGLGATEEEAIADLMEQLEGNV